MKTFFSSVIVVSVVRSRPKRLEDGVWSITYPLFYKYFQNIGSDRKNGDSLKCRRNKYPACVLKSGLPSLVNLEFNSLGVLVLQVPGTDKSGATERGGGVGGEVGGDSRPIT